MKCDCVIMIVFKLRAMSAEGEITYPASIVKFVVFFLVIIPGNANYQYYRIFHGISESLIIYPAGYVSPIDYLSP